MRRKKTHRRIFRWYSALWVSKIVLFLMRLAGKRATQLPGKICLKIDPTFLYFVDRPEHRIVITGTNGKTTCTNMIASMVEKDGLKIACNRYGSNLKTGICSAILEQTSFRNRTKSHAWIFEIDEMSSPAVLPEIHPQYIFISNLFDDQYDRIAYVHQLIRRINAALTPDMTLVLNADDPHLQYIGTKDHLRIYYGVEHDRSKNKELKKSVEICPKCRKRMDQITHAYEHIGQYHCSHCGFRSPQPKYFVKQYEKNGNTIIFYDGLNYHKYQANAFSVFSLYNFSLILTAANLIGITEKAIVQVLEDASQTKERYKVIQCGKKRLLNIMSKGCTPVPMNSAFRVACENAPSSLILVDEDLGTRSIAWDNMAWIYDVDFTILNDSGIQDVTYIGRHWRDYYIAMSIQGCNLEKVKFYENYEEFKKSPPIHQSDCIVLTYDFIEATLQVVHDLQNFYKEKYCEN